MRRRHADQGEDELEQHRRDVLRRLERANAIASTLLDESYTGPLRPLYEQRTRLRRLEGLLAALEADLSGDSGAAFAASVSAFGARREAVDGR